MNPVWVREVTAAIEKEFGFKAPPIRLRPHVFARGTTTFYRGSGDTKGITLSLPSREDNDYNRQFLVHELAHCVTIRYNEKLHRYVGAHDDLFYDMFWKMAKFIKLDLKDTLDREASYMSRSSVKMAKVHGIPGAFTKAREIKQKRQTRRAVKGWLDA